MKIDGNVIQWAIKAEPNQSKSFSTMLAVPVFHTGESLLADWAKYAVVLGGFVWSRDRR